MWNLTNCKLRCNLAKHTAYVNSVTVSPDGSLCASGGKDGAAQLWDLSEGKHLYELEAGDIINCLLFSPNRYWLCAATEKCIKIWDLESKAVVDELRPDIPPMGKRALEPRCISLAWSGDGQTLFSGYTDCLIRVWQVMSGVGYPCKTLCLQKYAIFNIIRTTRPRRASAAPCRRAQRLST